MMMIWETMLLKKYLDLSTKSIWRPSSLCVLILHEFFVSRVAAVEEKKDFPNHTTYTNCHHVKNVRERKIVNHVILDLLLDGFLCFCI